ncbi:MAG: hypothetical protein GY807_11845, partial [Gammaproteobacteria bacterium]|nr:hypothetical protein [Gammaproteobacteria bacterium]
MPVIRPKVLVTGPAQYGEGRDSNAPPPKGGAHLKGCLTGIPDFFGYRSEKKDSLAVDASDLLRSKDNFLFALQAMFDLFEDELEMCAMTDEV